MPQYICYGCAHVALQSSDWLVSIVVRQIAKTQRAASVC